MPCIMMIKKGDAPVPNSGGKWLDFQTVAIVDDTHVFGSLESAGDRFYHLTVSDRTKSDVDMQAYLEPKYQQDNPANPMTYRRKLQINPAATIAVTMDGAGSAVADFATLQAATVANP
jgi:hypothetical protein